MKNRSIFFKIIVFSYVCINLFSHTTYASLPTQDQSITQKVKTILHAPRNFYRATKALLADNTLPANFQKQWFEIINQTMSNDQKITKLKKLLVLEPTLINSTDSSLLTALHIAAQNNNVRLARFLLAHGATIEATDKDGNTPLHGAASALTVHDAFSVLPFGDTATFLITNHANVNVLNNSKQTPLHMAVISKNLDATQALLRAQANVNTQDNEGKTPLHYAVQYDEEKFEKIFIEKLLIDYGADKNKQDNEGKTPLQRVLDNGTPETAWLWTSNDMQGFKALQLLNYWPNLINTPNRQHQTKVFIEAKNNNQEFVHHLLTLYPADPNIPNPDGQTALHWAVVYSNEQMIADLIQHGALNSPDKNGIRPIDLAVSPKIKNLIIQELIKALGQKSLFGASLAKMYESYQNGHIVPLAQVLDGTISSGQPNPTPPGIINKARTFFNNLGILNAMIDELNKKPGIKVPLNMLNQHPYHDELKALEIFRNPDRDYLPLDLLSRNHTLIHLDN